MTASRTCRACGADLPGDVMWCLRCYEPVRLLTPREPQLPTVRFVEAKDELPASRWRAGTTTFGPVGRIVCTVLVLAFAPWTTNAVGLVVLWPAYLALAVVVLRSVWRKEPVLTTTIDEIATRGAPSQPAPAPVRVRASTSTVVAWATIGVAAIGVAVWWSVLDDTGRALLAMSASLALLVLAVRLFGKP